MSSVLTPEEAAAVLKVTPRTIYEWLKKGRIPGRKIGKVWRIPEVGLEEWLYGPLSPRGVKQESLSSPSYQTLSLEEWEKALDEWSMEFEGSPPLPDEALRRENLYEDRW